MSWVWGQIGMHSMILSQGNKTTQSLMLWCIIIAVQQKVDRLPWLARGVSLRVPVLCPFQKEFLKSNKAFSLHKECSGPHSNRWQHKRYPVTGTHKWKSGWRLQERKWINFNTNSLHIPLGYEGKMQNFYLCALAYWFKISVLGLGV